LFYVVVGIMLFSKNILEYKVGRMISVLRGIKGKPIFW